MRLHMAWVGPLAFLRPKSGGVPVDMIMTHGIVDLPILRYKDLPSDLSGFLSIIESCIKNNTGGLELYFHCAQALVSEYTKIIRIFIINMHRKYPGCFFRSAFHVVSFESAIHALSANHAELADNLKKYFAFVSDPRVINIRHRVNFRDLYNYCALYLYGGYTFDANVFAIGRAEDLLDEQKEFILRAQGVPGVEIAAAIGVSALTSVSLSALNHTPLMPLLEPILIISLGNAEDIIAGEVPDSTRCRYVIENGVNPHEWCVSDQKRHGKTFHEIDYFHDIFALRAQHNIPELIIIMNYLQAALIETLRSTYESEDFLSQSEKDLMLDISGYFLGSLQNVVTAPVIPKIQTQMVTLRRGECLHTALHENLVLNFFSVQQYSMQAVFFLNAPLIKFFSRSYAVQPEYFTLPVLTGERQAMLQHLGALTP